MMQCGLPACKRKPLHVPLRVDQKFAFSPPLSGILIGHTNVDPLARVDSPGRVFYIRDRLRH